MSDDDQYKAKPITLYVSLGGISNVDTFHYGKNVETVIDIELTEYDALKLVDMLKNKLVASENGRVFGSITFRLKGRLVL
jgi:hypothetical protein